MGKLLRNLRIGEKIGFGFGVVGLLFLGVIWQYHATLDQALHDYKTLHDVYSARKTYALAVEAKMLQAQRVEKHFILSRDEAFAEELFQYLEAAKTEAELMAASDPEATESAVQITRLMNDYGQRFQAVVDAWRSKGLDHDSGLQGAFRDAVHELEDMAGQFKVDRLYLLLLQIRRGEKDLGLRREEQYRDRVLTLVQEFDEELASSELAAGTKARFFAETQAYREAFLAYARNVLANNPINGGKGPFRQAAHRIEKLIMAHYVPELGEHILQVRRREKDYLLRLDKRYVDMALSQLGDIEDQIKAAEISEKSKSRFLSLSENYRRDFLALVEQNDRIKQLDDAMRAAVLGIRDLVRQSVTAADLAMETTRTRVDNSTGRNEKTIFWIVIVATSLGVILAFAITLPIVRPLRAMAGLLGQLASEEPAERIPYHPGGRDEVNAMAGSVNTMADHKARFIAWWKTSMREADACERLESLLRESGGSRELEAAGEALCESLAAKKQLLSEHYQKVHQLNGVIVKRADQLLDDAPAYGAESSLNTIRYAAKSVQTIVEMASFTEDREHTGG